MKTAGASGGPITSISIPGLFLMERWSRNRQVEAGLANSVRVTWNSILPVEINSARAVLAAGELPCTFAALGQLSSLASALLRLPG